MQQGTLPKEPGQYIESTLLEKNALAAWQLPVLTVTHKQLKKSFSVVARSTVFTLAHKHTRHPTSLWCKAICKSATQFNFCQSSRTVCGLFCSLSLFQTVTTSHLHLSTPSYYLSQTFLKLLITRYLFYILRFTLPSTCKPTAVSLRVLACICCTTPEPSRLH